MLTPSPDSRNPPPPAPAVRTSESPLFCTTHWSAVLAAGEADTTQAAAALESLCQAYWRPVYTYTRRRGHDQEAAMDLTQEFFARLLEGNWLRPADPHRGRFRSFLLRCLERFLVDEWRRTMARKRGGGLTVLSLEGAQEEEWLEIEPRDLSTPEQAYDRRWAEAVVDRAHVRLPRSYESDGQSDRFEMLKAYLTGGDQPDSYAEAAAKLGLTLPAVRSAIYKLRQRYGDAIRAEIAETVARPEEVETELRQLLDALGG